MIVMKMMRKVYSYLLQATIVMAICFGVIMLLLSQLRLNKSFDRHTNIYSLKDETKEYITHDLVNLERKSDIINYCSTVAVEMLIFDRQTI